MANLLVAGGGGYLGTRLCSHLQEKGHKINVIDSFWFGNKLSPSINYKEKDLWNINNYDFAGIDQILFLAGISTDPMAELDPASNFILNGALPAFLAYKAKLNGVKRYIYASSCSIYGFTDNVELSEDDATISDYPYGISKLQGERGVFQQYSPLNFSVIALRQGTVSGYSPRMRMDLIVNTMVKSALTTGKITVNNPNIWRPILDIRDCCNAWALAVEAPYDISGEFNLASNNYTVGQVANIVCDHLNEKLNRASTPIIIEEKNIADKRNYLVSTKKIEEILGYKSQYTITDTVDELLENLENLKDLEQDQYYNLRIFKRVMQHNKQMFWNY